MFEEIKKISSFLKRDFIMLATYKLAFTSSFIGMIFNLLYFILFGSLFESSVTPLLDPYGGNYIAYILIGSIGWTFLWSIMNTTAQSLRSEMMMGPLETILLSKTKLYTLMVSYASFGSFFGLLSTIVFFIIGYILFGISLSGSVSIFTLIIFILSAFMMMGFGMIFSGLTIWLKNIGNTIPFIKNIIMFFCGVYFPITVLPHSIQPVVNFIPFYYSIEGLRRSLISTTPQIEMIIITLILIGFVIFFNVIGIIILQKGLNKAKIEGSLSFY